MSGMHSALELDMRPYAADALLTHPCEGEDDDFPFLAICPRAPLIDATLHNDHLITVVCLKESNAQLVATQIRATYGCVFMQSKSVVRVFTRAQANANDIAFISTLDGVLKVTTGGKTVWRPSAPSDNQNKPTRPRKETSEVVVRRLDGNPVAADVATLIANHFMINGIRMDGSEAVGQMESVEAAQKIHGTLVGGAFVIARPGGSV